ncbi:MAG: NAD-dependent deacylase [Deltaproteobacteria bacterium]|nr:NAD-dependent deacylase [Deltaproteobacteria bacterium]
MTNQLRVGPNTRVLVLTGAGVSAESGIPTFRASADGLWENHRIEDVASPEGFAKDPTMVWRFYSERRARAATVAPNPGHIALAKLQRDLGDRMMLVTQNVDGLHQRAGSDPVTEIHGGLYKTRCTHCEREPFEDHDLYMTEGDLPFCAECAAQNKTSLLRPHIVWFGEMLNAADLHRVTRFISNAEDLIFVAAGTSGAVYPVANLVYRAKNSGGRTVLVNADEVQNASGFQQWIRGKSGEILPTLFDIEPPV